MVRREKNKIDVKSTVRRTESVRETQRVYRAERHTDGLRRLTQNGGVILGPKNLAVS